MRLKPAQIVVIAVALGAGGLAAMLMGGRRAPEPVAQQAAPTPPPLQTVEVLVAAADVPLGKILAAEDVVWRRWPEEATTGLAVRRSGDSGAAVMGEALGSIARSPFAAGEPIRPGRLVKGNRGFMSAILTPGMRAIAAPIDDPSRGAGAFILPNDRVDVILARRNNGAAAQTEGMTHSTSTILRNVRVLAVDQAVEERNGEKTIVGRTATLELTPAQSETLALARELGTLSLALRSIADSAAANLAGEGAGDGDALLSSNHEGRIAIVRHGVRTMSTSQGQE